MRRIFAIVTMLAATTAAAGQAESVLFVPSSPVDTVSGGGGTILRQVGPREVGVATPDSVAAFSTEKLAAYQAIMTLLGDHDGDGDHVEPYGELDALVLDDPSGSLDLFELYVSNQTAWGPAVSTPRLTPGGIAHLLGDGSNGAVELLLSQNDLCIALGLPLGTAVDIDAFTIDRVTGSRLLSLAGSIAANLFVDGAITPWTIQDGDVVRIPPGAVMASRAMVAFSEVEMNAFVTASGIRDHAGAPVGAVGDVTALHALDGRTTRVWGQNRPIYVEVPELAFGAQNLTGCGLCTTEAGGSILVVNGVTMGSSTGATLGDHLGLMPAGPALGVDAFVHGLHIRAEIPHRFVLGSPNPSVSTGDTFEIDVGISESVAAMILGIGSGPSGTGTVALSTRLTFLPTLDCFPEFYAGAYLLMLPVTVDPDGFGSWVSPPMPAAVSGNFLFQALALLSSGTLAASTPATVNVTP